MTEPTHLPVLFGAVMDALAVKADGLYIDCTLGGGGHAAGILERSKPGGRLLGLDRDAQAIESASRRLEDYRDRLVLVNRSFAEVELTARNTGFTQVDGIVFDLGLSSLQLASATRGFSFQTQGDLDMRFDHAQQLSAADIVNHWQERELADLIYKFGEEPASRTIARAIVRNRPLRTVDELAGVIASAVRRRGRIHPATRTFQALRIAVNDELAAIEQALPQAVELLRPGGRLAVISFHSLEDRIVKNFMREQQRAGNLSLLSKKPIVADPDEARANPRSRSAHLRAAIRITQPTAP